VALFGRLRDLKSAGMIEPPSAEHKRVMPCTTPSSLSKN
jgi:hypothetical protein